MLRSIYILFLKYIYVDYVEEHDKLKIYKFVFVFEKYCDYLADKNIIKELSASIICPMSGSIRYL